MKRLVVLDCEIYPNYSLFAFKSLDNGKVISIEIKGKDKKLSVEDHKRLESAMLKRTTFGFNSRNYDLPIILYALKRKTAYEIFELSNSIIENNTPGWKTMKNIGLAKPIGLKHFDIQEPAPGVRVSLKLYGGRMNSKKLQDLPIEPGTMLSEDQMEDTKIYCINDLDTTIDLYNYIEDRMKLRYDMSLEYGSDLMSKSDAQIAEVVIKSKLQSKLGKAVYAPKISSSTTFKYIVPPYISFESPQLKEALEIISSHDFKMDARGSVELPKVLKDMKIKLGHSVYQLGIGGIHTKEKSQTIIPNDNQILADRDVASYYPSIILNRELYPRHLGRQFLDVYREIVEKRLKAKKEKNKVVNESLKIVINGSFGKLGSKYSALYSPDLMLAVTLTGQLALLMLIELLENEGISVVSANTDGFVSLMNKDRYDLYCELCSDWEKETGFILEETVYKALYSRDVNNYLAVTEEYSKGKGIFTLDSIEKNPQAPIVIRAVKELLEKQIPVSETIRSCQDLKDFLTVRTVNGGAVFKDEYLGRVVRWIYSTDGETIRYKKNGNKVPKSDNSRPIMELSDNIPKDIDYERYIDEAMSILDDIGLTKL